MTAVYALRRQQQEESEITHPGSVHNAQVLSAQLSVRSKRLACAIYASRSRWSQLSCISDRGRFSVRELVTEGKYRAVPKGTWLSAFGNTSRNRFLPQRASTPAASICSPSVAEVRIAIRNVAARLLIEGLLVSRPIRYGPSDTEQPAPGFFALDELTHAELPGGWHFSQRYHRAECVPCLRSRSWPKPARQRAVPL